MQKKSDSIVFEMEDGEEVRFFVIEETMLAGENYLLVSDSMKEEAEAYILQEMMTENEETVYEMVEDETKLEVLSKLFSEIIENVDIKL